MSNIEKYTEKIFENIKHIDEKGNEFWYARELQIVLDYKKWQKFINVIENAKLACEQSEFIVNEHFTQVGKTSKMPNGGGKNILEYKLSRYACLHSNNNVNYNFGVNTKIVSVGSTTKPIIDYRLSRYVYYLIA